jgi:hypothetical protein
MPCQYPVSDKREDGTLHLCEAPATHYFDFSTYGKDGNGDHVSHRLVCSLHKDDPNLRFPGKTAVLIKQGAK